MNEIKNYTEATPKEIHEWQNGGDFFMTGNFDVMKLFVVIPAVIQIVMFGFMLCLHIIVMILMTLRNGKKL